MRIEVVILTIGPSLEEDGLTLCLGLLGPPPLDRHLVSLDYGPQLVVAGEDSCGLVLSQALGIIWRYLAHKSRTEWALRVCMVGLVVGIIADGCVLGTTEVNLMLSARIHCK